MSEKKSFWTTLPAILTGTATVIIAGLGVMSAISNSNNSADVPPQPVQSASPTPSASSSSSTSGAPPVFVDFPEADVTPESVDFGRQGMSDSSPQTITVNNPGASDLAVSGTELSGAGAARFKVTQDTCSSEVVSPGASCEISVVFSPGSPGSYFATLELEHNAQDATSRIALSGEGVLLQL